jgi:hypothetical protein
VINFTGLCKDVVFFGNVLQTHAFQGALAHGAIALNSVAEAEAVFGVTSAIDELKHGAIQESCADSLEFGSAPKVTVVM